MVLLYRSFTNTHQWSTLESSQSQKSINNLVLPENVPKRAFYTVILGEMNPRGAKLVNLVQNWSFGALIRPIIHQHVMLEGTESPKSHHKLLLLENVSISTIFTVILGEMDPKVAKLVNLVQNWTFRPLIRPIIHQQVMLEGPQSANSLHKLLLQENVSEVAFIQSLLVKWVKKC